MTALRIIRDLSSCPPPWQGAVVALGNFDGVHLGHQAILAAARAQAQEKCMPFAVMTFEPHPREILARVSSERVPLRLTSFRSKARLLASQGVEALFAVRFNRSFAEQSPQAFVDDILAKNLRASHIVTGYNFAFGKDRQGDTHFLERQAAGHGITLSICPPVRDTAGMVISSSAIRAQLAQGNMAASAAMLGRPYSIEGRVRQGERRGRLLGFPTANLVLKSLYKPRFGVYAIRARVEGDSNSYSGVANLGIRPSFGGREPLLEAHLFDADLALYGKHIHIDMIEFLRAEQAFNGVDALKRQISSDCEQARLLLAGVPA